MKDNTIKTPEGIPTGTAHHKYESAMDIPLAERQLLFDITRETILANGYELSRSSWLMATMAKHILKCVYGLKSRLYAGGMSMVLDGQLHCLGCDSTSTDKYVFDFAADKDTHHSWLMCSDALVDIVLANELFSGDRRVVWKKFKDFKPDISSDTNGSYFPDFMLTSRMGRRRDMTDLKQHALAWYKKALAAGNGPVPALCYSVQRSDEVQVDIRRIFKQLEIEEWVEKTTLQENRG
jgi:hypothetical protein